MDLSPCIPTMACSRHRTASRAAPSAIGSAAPAASAAARSAGALSSHCVPAARFGSSIVLAAGDTLCAASTTSCLLLVLSLRSPLWYCAMASDTAARLAVPNASTCGCPVDRGRRESRENPLTPPPPPPPPLRSDRHSASSAACVVSVGTGAPYNAWVPPERHSKMARSSRTARTSSGIRSAYSPTLFMRSRLVRPEDRRRRT
mmetsp:Transcript_30031/g.59425  ORF Transcript_30031/g.59425 Transcript_30031/m.59425 type:complete len:203 (-) Transcript_30031:9-617(-)